MARFSLFQQGNRADKLPLRDITPPSEPLSGIIVFRFLSPLTVMSLWQDVPAACFRGDGA
jgi:hypothetical protein